MHKKNQLLFLPLILIFACSSDKESNTSNQASSFPQIIDVANAETFDGYFSELVEDMYYIKLDTQEEALFQSVTNLFVTDENILVFDERGESVIIFDNNGEFISRINAPGDGPGEYRNLWKVAFDAEKDQVILAASGKILWFDIQANFIREKKVEYSFIKDIASLKDGRVVIHFGMNQSYSKNYQVIVMDSSLNEKKSYFPYSENVKSGNITNFYSHFSNSKEPLSVNFFSHEISRITGDSLFTEYKIDFGEDAIPEDFIETYVNDPNLNAEAVRNLRAEKGYLAIHGGAAQESDDFLLFLYSDRKDYFYALYDKKNKNTLSITTDLKVENGDKGYVYFPTNYKDYFVSTSSSIFLSQVYSNIKNIEPDTLLEEVENEIPFVWFIKFKENIGGE